MAKMLQYYKRKLVMQTIQINNHEIETLIASKKFMKRSFDDGYPAISKEEARKRVALAVEEVKFGKATLLTQEEYDKDMDEFLNSL